MLTRAHAFQEIRDAHRPSSCLCHVAGAFLVMLSTKSPALALCLTLLGPAAAKRQPSGAPAPGFQISKINFQIFFEMGHNVRQPQLRLGHQRAALRAVGQATSGKFMLFHSSHKFYVTSETIKKLFFNKSKQNIFQISRNKDSKLS